MCCKRGEWNIRKTVQEHKSDQNKIKIENLKKNTQNSKSFVSNKKVGLGIWEKKIGDEHKFVHSKTKNNSATKFKEQKKYCETVDTSSLH